MTKPRWRSSGFTPRWPATYTAGHPLVPIAGGATAAVVMFVLLRLLVFGNGGGEPAKSAAEIARDQTCLHLREFQVTRVGALRRGAELLVGDAAALRAADDEATAKKVDRLIGAARAYAAALDSEDASDDADANRGMLKASGGVQRATCGS